MESSSSPLKPVLLEHVRQPCQSKQNNVDLRAMLRDPLSGVLYRHVRNVGLSAVKNGSQNETVFWR